MARDQLSVLHCLVDPKTAAPVASPFDRPWPSELRKYTATSAITADSGGEGLVKVEGYIAQGQAAMRVKPAGTLLTTPGTIEFATCSSYSYTDNPSSAADYGASWGLRMARPVSAALYITCQGGTANDAHSGLVRVASPAGVGNADGVAASELKNADIYHEFDVASVEGTEVVVPMPVGPGSHEFNTGSPRYESCGYTGSAEPWVIYASGLPPGYVIQVEWVTVFEEAGAPTGVPRRSTAQASGPTRQPEINTVAFQDFVAKAGHKREKHSSAQSFFEGLGRFIRKVGAKALPMIDSKNFGQFAERALRTIALNAARAALPGPGTLALTLGNELVPYASG